MARFLCLVILGTISSGAALASQPNIFVLMVDELGSNHIGKHPVGGHLGGETMLKNQGFDINLGGFK